MVFGIGIPLFISIVLAVICFILILLGQFYLYDKIGRGSSILRRADFSGYDTLGLIGLVLVVFFGFGLASSTVSVRHVDAPIQTVYVTVGHHTVMVETSEFVSIYGDAFTYTQVKKGIPVKAFTRTGYNSWGAALSGQEALVVTLDGMELKEEKEDE